METHQSARAYRWVVIIVIKVDIDFLINLIIVY